MMMKPLKQEALLWDVNLYQPQPCSLSAAMGSSRVNHPAHNQCCVWVSEYFHFIIWDGTLVSFDTIKCNFCTIPLHNDTTGEKYGCALNILPMVVRKAISDLLGNAKTSMLELFAQLRTATVSSKRGAFNHVLYSAKLRIMLGGQEREKGTRRDS